MIEVLVFGKINEVRKKNFKNERNKRDITTDVIYIKRKYIAIFCQQT